MIPEVGGGVLSRAILGGLNRFGKEMEVTNHLIISDQEDLISALSYLY